jgi:hypothetical protein
MPGQCGDIACRVRHLTTPMGSKRKDATLSQRWKLVRLRYTWHLRSPFKSSFDRSHWWKDPASVDPIATLYELARRHPLFGEPRRTPPDLPTLYPCHLPHASEFLWLYGLKSWPRLKPHEQYSWKWIVGNLKGLDCRPEWMRCRSLQTEAFSNLGLDRVFAHKDRKQLMKLCDIIEQDMVKHPPPTLDMEVEIMLEALHAHRQGYLLLAVAPDMAVNDAKHLMVQEYRRLQVQNRTRKQRARCDSWLPLIGEFEDAEIGRGGAKSQVFVRYRRAIDGLGFSPS